jgi:hypothetical protein
MNLKLFFPDSCIPMIKVSLAGDDGQNVSLAI